MKVLLLKGMQNYGFTQNIASHWVKLKRKTQKDKPYIDGARPESQRRL